MVYLICAKTLHLQIFLFIIYSWEAKPSLCRLITSYFADSIYWPVFVIATLAAIIASQATISATFSIIKQALALGCFPRVRVIHTSKNFLGQIYIPDINWILMILCIAVTAGFENKSQIGNAYGKPYPQPDSFFCKIPRCVNDLNNKTSIFSYLGVLSCRI